MLSIGSLQVVKSSKRTTGCWPSRLPGNNDRRRGPQLLDRRDKLETIIKSYYDFAEFVQALGCAATEKCNTTDSCTFSKGMHGPTIRPTYRITMEGYKASFLGNDVELNQV